jgi:glycosyltransferase involved in cell wall biosynthesis
MANGNLEEIAQLLKPIKLGFLPENPLVSVIVGNYNYGQYVSQAIESVFHQTYQNFELIICDDGSTDDSCQIIEAYARRDPRIRLVTKRNGGQASAWNAAYQESKGHIVCTLDSDDRYLPDKLEIVVRSFKCHPDGGFLGHRMFLVDEDGHRRGVTPLLVDPPSGWYGPFVVRCGDVPNGLTFGSGICLRREVSSFIFPLPEKVAPADGSIVYLSPLITPLIGISVPLAEYRRHSGSVTFTSQITLEYLNHELRMNRLLCEVQREYLRNVHPRLCKLFPGVEGCALALAYSYSLKRLGKDTTAFSAYRTLLRSETFQARSFMGRWFWRLSILLPRPIFGRALDIYWGHGLLKQFIWRTWLTWSRHNDSRCLAAGI